MQAMLADRSLRDALEAMARRRVPAFAADDIVRSALAEALDSETAPEDPEALRRWLAGVVRHKVADHDRRTRRPQGLDEAKGPEEPEARSARNLSRRADKGTSGRKDAKTEPVPAPPVRQRVSRLSRHLRERWQREVALALALATLLGVGGWVWRERTRPQLAHDAPPSSPREMARKLREHALERCDQGAWQECLAGLDSARLVDPEGDAAARVKEARAAAARAVEPGPLAPGPSAVPTTAAPSRIAVPTAAAVPTTTTGATSAPPTEPTGSVSHEWARSGSTGGP
jgi:DNA-directed RNA polymerase specialized sigma24 family protein